MDTENCIYKPGMSDMFANYGLAMMRVGLVEQMLLVIFYSAQRISNGDLSAPALWEATVHMEKQTFGTLFAKLKTTLHLPEELEKEIETAVNKRNELAHRFFPKHLKKVLVGDPVEMNKELIEHSNFFMPLGRKLDKIADQLISQWDLPREEIDKEVLALLRLPANHLLDRPAAR